MEKHLNTRKFLKPHTDSTDFTDSIPDGLGIVPCTMLGVSSCVLSGKLALRVTQRTVTLKP